MDNIEHFAEVKCIRAGSISKTLLGDGEVLMAFVGKKRLLRDSWRREQRRGARRGGGLHEKGRVGGSVYSRCLSRDRPAF